MSPARQQALPTVDPRAVALRLHQQIGHLLAQGGAVDWSTLQPFAQILANLGPPPASDPTGACSYTLPTGENVCSQMAQSQCHAIGGLFEANTPC